MQISIIHMNPKDMVRIMKNRLISAFCIFLLSFSMLYLRIGFLSDDEKLVTTGLNQSSYTLTFQQTRGQIYDCNFIPLVSQDRDYLACVLPTPQNMGLLSHNPALKTPENLEKLFSNGKPFFIESSLPKINIPQVTMLPVNKRCNDKQLAQHIVGYVDNTALNGLTGIEQAYNDILTANAQVSKITYQLDGSRTPLLGVKPSVSLAPFQTNGVVLTIDKRIQEICEKVGNQYLKKGAIVVMDPYNGKLKAVASFPTYNANHLSAYINDKENSPMLNRAFCAFSVGSVFKIVTTATALSQGMNPLETYYCNGKIDVLDVTIKCHEEKGHGKVDLKTALAVSCNPYFIHLASTLSPQKFLNMASDLSFGKATQFTTTFKTASGTLPSLNQLQSPAAVANFAFGQGSLMATPVQVAQMMSSIVNDGDTMTASLIEGITLDGKMLSDMQEQKYPIKAMDKKVTNAIKSDLIDAVMNTPNQNSRPSFTTAGGKTGTAQTGQLMGKEELLQGWFAGFYPADKPQYVIVVLCEEALSGNQNASPVFKQIVDDLTAPTEIPNDHTQPLSAESP